MKNYKWGIIGPGKIAHKFAEGISYVQNAILYGVASSSIDRAHDFAKKYSVPNVYNSYEELLCDSEIDIVYIATTNNFHFEHVQMCISHNKHCLCEKPFTLNSNELQIIVNSARQKKVFLMEALWTRFLPSIEDILQRIRAKEIGEITQISANFGFSVPFDQNSRLFSPQLGGGALFDIGIYPVFFALFFLGEPNSIKVVMNKTQEGVDISNEIEFEYSNGEKAFLQSSFSENLPCEAEIEGTKGKIILKRMWHCPTHIVLEKDGNSMDITPKYIGNGYNYEITEVQQCLDNQQIESSKMPLDFSLLVMKIIDKIYNLSH